MRRRKEFCGDNRSARQVVANRRFLFSCWIFRARKHHNNADNLLMKNVIASLRMKIRNLGDIQIFDGEIKIELTLDFSTATGKSTK